MAIQTYQSKKGKKLYEVYVALRKNGKRIQKRQRLDFKGNPISSRIIARRVEFELKRELIAKRDGLPIWKWENWLEEALKRMKFSLKYSTVFNYEKTLKKWTPKAWNEKELTTFKKVDIHFLIFETMKETTPHQKKNVKKMLSRIFEIALEDELISKNPTKGIKLTLPQPKQQVLKSSEATTLLEQAQTSNHRFYAHWTLALFTGMRNGELYALRVKDVDLSSGIIHINKQFTSRDGLHETKTNLSRVVPIADEIKPLLEGFIAKGGHKETFWEWKNEGKTEKFYFVLEDLLLPRLREWRSGEQSSILRDFCSGIGISQVKFHDLRATFITNMLASGVALNVVMSIVGHRRISTTDVYNRLAGIGVKGSTNKLSYGASSKK